MVICVFHIYPHLSLFFFINCTFVLFFFMFACFVLLSFLDSWVHSFYQFWKKFDYNFFKCFSYPPHPSEILVTDIVHQIIEVLFTFPQPSPLLSLIWIICIANFFSSPLFSLIMSNFQWNFLFKALYIFISTSYI